ncbi:MAG: exopolysaccharide biosynthesis polyprenyl glycosylphosphotransferase [bacterium]|nr:exopolysaccharide biosynthesis polyprenyl glycosylphosphotransferase [bacterium]
MSAYLPHTARLRTFLGLVDIAALGVAIWLAHQFRFGYQLRILKWRELLDRPGLLLVATVAGLVLATAAELYEPEVLHRRREVIIRVLVMVVSWSMVVVFAIYLHSEWAYGRGILLLTAGFWSLLLIAGRWIFTAWRRQRTRFSALVVGDPDAVRRFCRELRQRPSAPWTPVDGSGVPLERIASEVALRGTAIVVLAGGYERALEMGHDLAKLHFSGVPVVAASELWAWLEERLPLEALTPALFLHQPGFGAVHWTLFNRFTRIADVMAASVLLIVTAPVLVLAAVLIFLTNGPPILYHQRRVGQFGRPFTMFKLRTMRRDAELNGPEFAAERDPRTVVFGRFLRRFRIDELPQLVNILKGEMSLVGPRPERPEFERQLVEKIPYYAFRHAVPPGLSGWAQVNTSYARDLEDHQRKLEFDLYFIRERSVRLYLLTLLRTVSAALVGARR